MQKRDELKNRLEELFSEDSVDFNGNGGTHKEDARKDPFPKPLISETTPTGHEEKEYKTATRPGYDLSRLSGVFEGLGPACIGK